MIRTLLIFVIAIVSTTLHSQIFTVNFEDQDSLPNMTENCNDGLWDYFDIVTNADIGPNFLNSGSYLAAQDVDALPCTMNPQTALWTDIDISSCSGNAYLCFDVAEDDDGTNEDWDGADQVLISYAVDGGSFQEFVGIQNDGSNFNSEPSLDLNCDGIGEGAVITNVFTKYCFQFNLSGNTLNLEFLFQLNAANEDIAIDNVEIYCDNPPAAPLQVVCSAALPVELVNFKGELRENRVSLNWTTLSEVNNDRFEIEHSVNGIDFIKIGETNGHGNSSKKTDYFFEHLTPQQGLNYYRLKQIDFDGNYEYSQIESVRFMEKGEFSLYPNLVDQSFTIEFNSATTIDYQIEIIDIVGRKLHSEILSKESQRYIVDASMLKAGNYFVRISNNDFQEVRKITKN